MGQIAKSVGRIVFDDEEGPAAGGGTQSDLNLPGPLLLSRFLKTLAALLASLLLVTKQLRDIITPFHLVRTAVIDIANTNMQIILAFLNTRCRLLANE